MTDTPQSDSVAQSVITAALANPIPTPVPLVALSATTQAPSYKSLAQEELAKIKASLVNLESHLANIRGEAGDEITGAVKKLESYAKNTTAQSWVVTVGIVVFIIIEIIKKIF